MEKLTNVKALEFVLANCELPSEIAEKVSKMKAQFEKKASGSRKPTKVQLANEGLKADILAFLVSVGKGKSVSEIMKECPSADGLSNQKVSSLVRQLVADDLVVRTEENRKAIFTAKAV